MCTVQHDLGLDELAGVACKLHSHAALARAMTWSSRVLPCCLLSLRSSCRLVWLVATSTVAGTAKNHRHVRRGLGHNTFQTVRTMLSRTILSAWWASGRPYSCESVCLLLQYLL